MSTLAEIKAAVPMLTPAELAELKSYLAETAVSSIEVAPSSAFDLPPLEVGGILKPFGAEDDFLEEMTDAKRA